MSILLILAACSEPFSVAIFCFLPYVCQTIKMRLNPIYFKELPNPIIKKRIEQKTERVNIKPSNYIEHYRYFGESFQP